MTTGAAAGAGAPGSFDDASLARALVAQLQARGAVSADQLTRAGAYFAEGRLPTTALLLAGVTRSHVVEALAAVTGLARAPEPTQWSTDARKKTGIHDDVWGRARAVPFGMNTEGNRLLVAFADPKMIALATSSLPAHDAFVCLEDDVDTVLLAAQSGATLIDARVQATLVTPPPSLDVAAAALPAHVPSPKAPHHHVVAQGSAQPLVDPRASAPVPTRIGPFIVDSLLAQGGMGVVYDAHDEHGRRAAVKVVHAHLLHVGDVRARFVREAQATQRIDHPNIVRVLGVGNDPAYLAVEFLEGGTVGALLERQGKLPLVVALELFAQMIAGLAAAHAQGIVHRDLKPDNLLLSKDGTLKIADFGIARELDATAMTQTGSTLGTPAYMSPEQARAEVIDPRSDLYTAGVILYELLTGRNPFIAESIGAIVANILRGRAAPLFEVDPSVPEGIESLVTSMMSLDREARPKNAAAVLAAIKPVIDDVRRLHPRVIADVMERPSVTQLLRKEQADALVAAARVHLQSGTAHREAAALCLFRAQILVPEHPDARALLAGLAQEGVTFGKSSAKLAELEREIHAKPDDAVLLQRAAQLARQEGDIYKSAIYFRRYLRVRPDDNYVRQQAEKLTQVLPATSVLPREQAPPPAQETQEWKAPRSNASLPPMDTQQLPSGVDANDANNASNAQARGTTMLRIAGHISPGGFAAAAPVAPPTGATQRLAAAARADALASPDNDDTPGALAAVWHIHKTKIIAAVIALVVLVGGVRAVKGFIEGAQKSIDDSSFGTGPRKPRAPGDVDKDSADLEAARAAATGAQWGDVEKHCTAIIDRSGNAFDMSEALLLRGKARLAQNRALAAVEDLTRVVDRYGNQEQAAREALVRRGIAYVRAGEKEKAKEDLSNALRMSVPTHLKALAHLERGLIFVADGDIAAARADLERAETYTPPGDDTHIRAVDALEKLK